MLQMRCFKGASALGRVCVWVVGWGEVGTQGGVSPGPSPALPNAEGACACLVAPDGGLLLVLHCMLVQGGRRAAAAGHLRHTQGGDRLAGGDVPGLCPGSFFVFMQHCAVRSSNLPCLHARMRGPASKQGAGVL